MKVLSEYIKHHVKEEEKEMFPKRKQTQLDLKELGGQLAERKFRLMEQRGVEEDEVPARPRSRSGRRSSKAKQARGGSRRATSHSRSARGH